MSCMGTRGRRGRPRKCPLNDSVQAADKHAEMTIGESHDEIKDDVAVEIAQWIICGRFKKQRINDADLRTYLPKSLSKSERISAVEKASKMCNEALGIKLIKSEKNDKDIVWFIVSTLPSVLQSKLRSIQLSEKGVDDQLLEKAKTGFLMSVLMFVFMGCNPCDPQAAVTEESLFTFIHGINLDSEAQRKLDIRSLISPSLTAEFVSQGWLAYEKRVIASGNETTLYKLGRRTEAILDPMRMLEWYCKIDTSCEPKSWKNHYKYAEAWQKISN